MPLKLTKPKGRRFWYLRGTVRGQSIYESTKVTDRDAADQIRIKREAGILHRSIHGAATAAAFLEAAVLYMEAGRERRYLRPLIDHLGGDKLIQVDQAAIDRAARVIKPDAAPATVNRQVYGPVAAVLHFAAERGLCEYRKIKRVKEPRGRVHWLKPEQAERLIDHCAPHMATLVTFLFYTGARLSEALYLDWREIDLKNRRVVFLDTKNGTNRGVPLHARVFEMLANMPQRDGPVFLRPGRKIGRNKREMVPYARRTDGGGGQIATGFNAACRRAGIHDFHPHDCRHTWATWLYDETGNLRQLMELGGWKSISMVERYAHVNPDHLRAAIDALPNGTKSVQPIKKKEIVA
jgi:integrase